MVASSYNRVAFTVIAIIASFSPVSAQTANKPGTSPANAQAAQPLAPTGEIAPPDMKQVIASNAGSPQKICGAIKPILYADPNSATDLIDAAQSQPQLMEPLCECLSQTQTILKSKDRDGAKAVAKAVAASSPAFQACYAVALAPTDTGPAVTPTTISDSGNGSLSAFNTQATPSTTGFGGGPLKASDN